jgi:arginase
MSALSKVKPLDILGIATASGASVRGCGMGPEALRVAGLIEALLDLDLQVVDHGDLRHEQPDLITNPSSSRLPEERKSDVLDLAARASDKGMAILAEGNIPVFIGGDHSIAMGTVSAVARHCVQKQKPVLCCGSMPTPTIIPPLRRPRVTCTACR